VCMRMSHTCKYVTSHIYLDGGVCFGCQLLLC